MNDALLVARNIHKSYLMGAEKIQVLKGLDLTLLPGEIVSVVGASGVGKSTLLHILGLLDVPDEGTVEYRGEDLLRLSATERGVRRNRAFGFIFQFYHLVPELTALENVLLPTMIAESTVSWRRGRKEARRRAKKLLKSLGLAKRLRHRPAQLSGGERQRVAIARALVNSPDLILCDEPTGNLDPETSVGVREALWSMNREYGLAMLIVTHDEWLASRGHRILRMVGGRLEEGPAVSPEDAVDGAGPD